MRIHFIGCEGVSMRRLMQLSKQRQNYVTGSDLGLCGHDPKNVHGADLVVYTCAVGEDNVELKEARRLGIPTMERAALLGELSSTYSCVIAIAGAHGKTTATGMSAAAMRSLSPTVHIGGDMNELAPSRNPVHSADIFLTEACEYRRSFLHLRPDIGAILNVDLDHTDYYRDFDDILSAYEQFASQCGTVLVNSDDRRSMYLGSRRKKYTFGLNGLAYFRGENLRREKGNSYSFDLVIGGRRACRVHCRQPGFHNIYNALCSVALSVLAGLSPVQAAADLKTFCGVKRRFECVGSLCGATVISDYAHHPKEIRATLLNAKKCTSGNVYAVFQPHTYSRTASLCEDFARALSLADYAAVLPIFPARESPMPGVSSHDIVLSMTSGGARAAYIDTFCGALSYLKERVSENDLIVFLGAGDIDKLARDCH